MAFRKLPLEEVVATLDIRNMGITPKCFGGAFTGKRVWVSGHSGFKGAWLCEWLLALGAQVHGFSQPAPTEPALSEQLGLSTRLTSCRIGDIRDPQSVVDSLITAAPDFIFHLAAQPLVRASYENPAETWNVNVLGTVNVLEALRGLNRPCAAVIVTSDKCYENRETGADYREEDALGGYDPYSASKGAVEIAVASWRRSFFRSSAVKLVSARAGNVIGGGDWAKDRIVPDCIRALRGGVPIPVRNRVAVRPWQHVLEPLSGYLWLAAIAAVGGWTPTRPEEASAGAFNFGPDPGSSRTVEELVLEIIKNCGGNWVDRTDPRAVHEARLLGLATGKAERELEWRPVWDFSHSITKTAEWYGCEAAGESVAAITQRQIAAYWSDAGNAGVRWAG